jgi:1-acyl-sn-glycerol-3-phosphate acyltransferase
MSYAIIRGLARLLLALFYRRVEVHGLARVPRHGPLVVAANHHNGLVDAMLVLAALPRRLAPLAKAPLFAHPLIGPFLWLAGAIPVHRRQDSSGDPSRNAAMFAQAAARLRGGGAILIFPEGVSQPEPVLMPLRTGLARLVLEAGQASPGLRVTVVPVGLVFHRPAEFRTGRALVVVGEPVSADDLVGRDGAAAETAVRELTGRLAAALRALIVEADDRQTLRLLEIAHAVWSEAHAPASGAERLAWMQEALRRWRTLPPRLRRRAERVRRELERYDKDVARAGAVPGDDRRGGRLDAVREGLAMILGLPLALVGIAVHAAGYRATALVVRALRPEPDTAATFQLAAGLVLFPLSWSAEAVALAWALGAPAAWTFAALLGPTGFFALAWRERLHRVGGEARGWLGLVAHGDLAARLRARRRWLREELAALARVTEADAGRPEVGR